MGLRQGDRVEILTGKRQGQIAKVTEIQDAERVRVQIEGVPYEISYLLSSLKVKIKASKLNPLEEDGTVGCTPLQVSGDKKLRLTQYLVKAGKLCPSWPYSCTGDCAAAKEQAEVTKTITKNASSGQ